MKRRSTIRKKKVSLLDVDVLIGAWESPSGCSISRGMLVERARVLGSLDRLMVVRYDPEDDAIYFSALPEEITV